MLGMLPCGEVIIICSGVVKREVPFFQPISREIETTRVQRYQQKNTERNRLNYTGLHLKKTVFQIVLLKEHTSADNDTKL